MWLAGSTPSVQEFQDCMQEIRCQSEQAYQYLVEIPLQLWTLAYDGGSRCGILTTNSSESFNNMLKGCRMLPVSAIIMMSYQKLVDSFESRRRSCLYWKQKNLRFTPKILKISEAWEKNIQNFQAMHYGGHQYVVSRASISNPGHMYNFVIDLGNKSCTCGQWQGDGVPCVHVHCLFHSFKQRADDCVSHMYSVQRYQICYSGQIRPVIFPNDFNYAEYPVLPPIRPEGEISCSGRRRQKRFQGK